MHQRRHGLCERELPEELILYDPESDRAFLLNRAAAVVWELCDGASTSEQIAQELSSVFGIPVELALTDVRTMTADFERQGLLLRLVKEVP